MRNHLSQRSDAGRGATRLATSATAAATTIALIMPLALATTAAAAVRGAHPHRITLHAARASSHGHHDRPLYVADLTAFSVKTEFPVRPFSAASVIHSHERLTPTASARGPPDLAPASRATRQTAQSHPFERRIAS